MISLSQTFCNSLILLGLFLLFQITSGNNMQITEGTVFPIPHILISVTAPPQFFCCTGCRGRCEFKLTAMLDFRRIIRSCPGGRSVVPQALIGWVGEKQSNTPEACGVVVNCHNWENPISIPVYATVDGKYDRDQTVNYNVHANILNVQSGSVTATPQTLNIGKVSVSLLAKLLYSCHKVGKITMYFVICCYLIFIFHIQIFSPFFRSQRKTMTTSQSVALWTILIWPHSMAGRLSCILYTIIHIKNVTSTLTFKLMLIIWNE